MRLGVEKNYPGVSIAILAIQPQIQMALFGANSIGAGLCQDAKYTQV